MSHETIYRSLFIQAGGMLKKELMQHLRSSGLSAAPCTLGLAESPTVDRRCHFHPGEAWEIEDRAIPGHWEGDLLAGTSNSHIATWWNDVAVYPAGQSVQQGRCNRGRRAE